MLGMEQGVGQRSVCNKLGVEGHLRGRASETAIERLSCKAVTRFISGVTTNYHKSREATVNELFSPNVAFRSSLYLDRSNYPFRLKGVIGSGREKQTVTEKNSVESMVISGNLISLSPDSAGNCSGSVILTPASMPHRSSNLVGINFKQIKPSHINLPY